MFFKIRNRLRTIKSAVILVLFRIPVLTTKILSSFFAHESMWGRLGNMSIVCIVYIAVNTSKFSKALETYNIMYEYILIDALDFWRGLELQRQAINFFFYTLL